MIISDGYPFEWKGTRATMFVLRNSGDCWGRFADETGAEFDVNPREDVYEWDDDEAAEEFIAVAADPETQQRVTEAESWLDVADKAVP